MALDAWAANTPSWEESLGDDGSASVTHRPPPFIGAALNSAARVMNLADGGQVMVAGDVASAAGGHAFLTHSHGPYTLKNIHEPVEVVELLYADGQQPKAPAHEPGA